MKFNSIILLMEILYEIINSYKKTELDSYKHKLQDNCEIIPVLTYHTITNDYVKKAKYQKSSIVLSWKIFKMQIKYLKKKRYKTLNCTELYLWHEGKIKLPKKSVLITFDDGNIWQEKYAMPILNKYNMKSTFFIIGNLSYNNFKNSIKYNRIPQLRKLYPNFDFESHTFNLHKPPIKALYNETYKDAATQNKYFNFTFLAYPYGAFSSEMIRAYKDIGIKMAFTYGKNSYATRRQNIYRISRIKVNANEDFSKFTRWFK